MHTAGLFYVWPVTHTDVCGGSERSITSSLA